MPNNSADVAIVDVFKNGRQIDTLYPESRFFIASQQQQHIPTVRSTLKEDLYVVYEGQNPDTGRPIIKAHLNPLVSWIWIGVLVMIFGTDRRADSQRSTRNRARTFQRSRGRPGPPRTVGAGD